MHEKYFGRYWMVPLLAVFSLGAAGHTVSLVETVKTADAKAVRALLQQHIDVNVPEVDGTTALHWAVEQDDLEKVDLLIGAGANVKAANRYDVTALSLACTNGNAAIIERLLKAGADPNTALPGGETALMTAALTGKADAIKVLLAHGADVNAREKTNRQTALMWAAAQGNVAAMEVLIEGGAEVYARSTEHNFRKTTGDGKGSGVDPDLLIEFSPFLFAVRNGEIDAVRALLDAGADVNEITSDPNGASALIIAAINAHWELGAFLLDKGTDPNAAGQGWTALHQVARTRTLTLGQVPPPVPTGRISSLDFAKKLIARGADVNARMTKEISDGYRHNRYMTGATPFLIAAKGGDHEMMRLLAANGADSNLMNVTHTTPLMVAAGVAMYSPGEDTGTLEDHLKAVKVALEMANDVNAVNDDGETAAFGAARFGSNAMVQLLFDKGARLDVKNKKGLTPYMYAEGRDSKGKALFLGAKAQPQTAALIGQLLTQRGLPVDNLAPLDGGLGFSDRKK